MQSAEEGGDSAARQRRAKRTQWTTMTHIVKLNRASNEKSVYNARSSVSLSSVASPSEPSPMLGDPSVESPNTRLHAGHRVSSPSTIL